MENYRKGLERINSKEHYDEYANSGFFTVIREDNGLDTRAVVCDRIAKHFGLVEWPSVRLDEIYETERRVNEKESK
jgi:hypothetical protein